MLRDARSFNPIRNEHVGLPFGPGVSVRREDEVLAVGREHREAIEGVAIADALEAGAVEIDQVDVEVSTLRVRDVRREDQTLAVRMPRRRKVGLAKMRDLTLIAAVPVHHEQ